MKRGGKGGMAEKGKKCSAPGVFGKKALSKNINVNVNIIVQAEVHIQWMPDVVCYGK